MQNNRLVRQRSRRDEVIQKIINAVHLVQATPTKNREAAVNALDDPDLQASFTSDPKWKIQFVHATFWDIIQALHNSFSSFAISLKLDDDQWLNLNATIYTHLFTEQMLIIAAEIFIFGTLLISAWAINRFTKPLEGFKDAAERLGIDLKIKPLDIYGPAVVREAAGAINVMQKRIVDLVQDRTQMLAAISHDLRTPITRMKLRAQMMDDEELAESYIKDLGEMEQMINETLEFAREDCSAEEESKFDLVSLLKTICDDARDMGYKISFNSTEHRVPFSGKRIAIKRAFTNLTNNGIRYGNKVKMTLTKRNRTLVIHIDDEGEGIPESELEQVFVPFYRREQSRSRDTGGVGLGLAVTRDIIRAHKGRITLKNIKPRGLRVSVQFLV